MRHLARFKTAIASRFRTTMAHQHDLKSILSFLPLTFRSSTFSWRPETVDALETIARGPDHSQVTSGEALAQSICDIKLSLGLFSEPLAPSAPEGYSLFFDELLSRQAAGKWFNETVPALASMLLMLPSLLETHWQRSDSFLDVKGCKVRTGLRLLDQQEAGIVVLSQELIGAILACSLFSLFPIANRSNKYLPMINFDNLFASLFEHYSDNQENKIMCIIHYFERICYSMPKGFVSFERKVLPFESGPSIASYPEADFWSKSSVSLCSLELHQSGIIEDHSMESLQVDFANKYLGGGVLNRGCVQEEILFMICPELIAGMLFLPAMMENEAVEIVGAERFSCYSGYASSFRFAGDYQDQKAVDCTGRRRRRIVAIDALCNPGKRQYISKYLLREINKAFCGFLNAPKQKEYEKLFQSNDQSNPPSVDCGEDSVDASDSNSLRHKASLEAEGRSEKQEEVQRAVITLDGEESIGIVTGNWGCGAFGGDPELKTMIQWLAASQALRPWLAYYTFGMDALRNLDRVSSWILMHGWTVGDLWDMVVEYSSQRSKEETRLGFFSWLLPSGAPFDDDDDSTFDPMEN